jgi:hypothetical protein
MSSSFEHSTTYFWEEGKPNLRECLRVSFEAAGQQRVQKVVIFTGAGEGVRIAIEEWLSLEEFAHIQLIAVTFPHGQQFTSPEHLHGISESEQNFFLEHGVSIVRAHLPFEPIRSQFQGHGILGQDFSLIGNTLNIFGGSMSLCVQAVLMACDAGLVRKGEHVISLTSDTSILVRSAPTSYLLTEFIVREVFCKPILLTIGKKEKLEGASGTYAITDASDSKLIEG